LIFFLFSLFVLLLLAEATTLSPAVAVTAVILIGLITLPVFWAITPYWVIRIEEDGVRLGGLFFCRRIPFGQISFVQCGSLTDKLTDMSSPPPLIIETGGKKYKIRLKVKHAESCMRLILAKSPEAGGLDYAQIKSRIRSGEESEKFIKEVTEIQPKIYNPKNDPRLRNARNLIRTGICLLLIDVLLLLQYPSLESSKLLEFIVVFLMVTGAGITFLGKGYAERKEVLSEEKAGLKRNLPGDHL